MTQNTHGDFETKNFNDYNIYEGQGAFQSGNSDNETVSLKALHDELNKKLNAQQETLQQLTQMIQRPSLSGQVESLETKFDKQYVTAFTNYLRFGDDSELRTLQRKSLSSTNGEGGYLIAQTISQQIGHLLKTMSPMRQLANIVTTRTGRIDLIMDQDDFGTEWVSETGTRSETATMSFAKISIPAHEVTAMPKATQRLLDDAAFDVENWIAGRIAEKIAVAENDAFVTGDGTNKPTGFLSKATVANASWSWGNLGYIATGSAGALPSSNPYDVLVDMVYALKSPYRQGATWLMNSATAATFRKFKDSDGRYLWQEVNSVSGSAYLLGYPVVIADAMPSVGSNTYPVAFGNFSYAYTIVDGQDIRTLRDPFTAKPHVLFYTTKRVGGDVTNFEAIKLLKCAAS